MTTTSTWTFNWITSWDLPDALPSHGNADSHVFFQPALVRAWTETYRSLRRIEPRFLEATDGNNTVFLPLVLDCGGWKDAWIRVLQPVGHNEYDYHDPIFGMGGWKTGMVEDWSDGIVDGKVGRMEESSNLQPEVMSGFWQAFSGEVEKQRDEFDLFCMPRVRECCIGEGFGFQPVEKAPYIDLSKYPSFDTFMVSRSGNLRQGIKRKQKRMAEQGSVRFRVYAPHETAEALGALAEFRKNHEIRWPRAYRAPRLFENLIKYALPAGLLHLSAIECSGRPVSWHFGFVHNKRFYWYVPVYDNRFSQFSPGLLHIAYLIEECYKLGVTTFDFLRGQERYKYEWTDNHTDLFGMVIQSQGLGFVFKQGFASLLNIGRYMKGTLTK